MSLKASQGQDAQLISQHGQLGRRDPGQIADRRQSRAGLDEPGRRPLRREDINEGEIGAAMTEVVVGSRLRSGGSVDKPVLAEVEKGTSLRGAHLPVNEVATVDRAGMFIVGG
jgi:hypothetical protein